MAARVRNRRMATSRSSRMWLGFGSVTRHPQTFRRLARFALRRVASASRPAQFGRSQSVFSVVGRFHNSALSVSSLRDLSRRFAKSALLLIQVAAHYVPRPQHMRRSMYIASQTKFEPAICATLGSSVAYRLPKSLNRLASAQSSIYFWETDHCRPRDANL